MSEKLPEGWVETTLGEVVSTNDDSINRNFGYSELEYLDTGSIIENKIERFQKYTLTEAPSRAKRLVQDGDIVYSTVRPNQRHYGFIRNPKKNTVVSTGFAVIRSKENSYSKFIFYWLTQNSVTDYLHQLAEQSTSAYPSIKPIDIENLPITIPKSTVEQKAIAAVLSAFDDKIELLREQNETLETLAQTIFKEWFVHFNFPDKDGKPYRDNGGEMVDSELGEIPKGWRVDELGNVASIIAGGDKPKNVTSQKTGRNIIPIYSNGIKNEGLYGYTDTARIFEESVTVSARGTIGFVCLRMEPYLPIVRLLSIIPNKKDLSSKYLFFWLKNYDINGFGTTQQQLTVPVFKKSEILIAASAVINQFTEIVDSIYYKIKNNTAQIQTLSKTRDTLLPKLMSGETRVKGFEQ